MTWDKWNSHLSPTCLKSLELSIYIYAREEWWWHSPSHKQTVHGKNGGNGFSQSLYIHPQNWSQIMVHKFYNIFAIIWVGPTNNLC